MKKILIVDDELAILSGLSRALRDLCGFHEEVRTVVNGREAIYEASCCFYDICFLDVMLPDINGLVVKNDISSVSPKTKIVLMSAIYTSDEFQRIAEESGSFHIEKPFDFEQIKHVTRCALEGNSNHNVATALALEPKIKEKRTFKRTTLNKKISFFINDSEYIKIICWGLDISYSGLGIQTYYPLERGQIVFFNSGVSNEAGLVAWSSKEGNNNFKAGIKFI